MKPSIVKHAVRLFPRTAYSERSSVNHLRREYIKARAYLGDRWVLAKRIGRKANSDGAVLAVSVAGGLPLLVWDVAQKVMA